MSEEILEQEELGTVDNTVEEQSTNQDIELSMEEWEKENGIGVEAKEEEKPSEEAKEAETVPEKELEKPKEAEQVAEEKKEDELIPAKRYRDLQSHADRTIAAKEKEIAELKKAILPKKENDNDSGSNKEESKELGIDDDEGISEPTDEEWDLYPKLAFKKQMAYENLQRAKKDLVIMQEEKQFAVQKEYESKRNASFSEAYEEYPDFKDPNSELSKLVDKLADEDYELAMVSSAPLRLAKEAARFLGIKSAVSKEENKPTKIKRETSYIMKQSGGKVSNQPKDLTDEDFLSLSPEKQDEYMKREFFKT